METDMRESANDCILASGEGHGSRGETFQPIYVASPVSASVEHPVLYHKEKVCWSKLFQQNWHRKSTKKSFHSHKMEKCEGSVHSAYWS
jgi:hypothetical protein